MVKSDSTAGDMAGDLYDHLSKVYGSENVEWILGEDDTIGVLDANDVQHFVKVELA